MDKIWYLYLNHEREGPLAYIDLERDGRLTPDTLVWREGFPEWKKIRDVPELQELFKEAEVPKPQNDLLKKNDEENLPQDEIVMDMQEPPYLLWLLVALIILSYVVFQLYLK